jgi:hypothetical protein
VTAVGLADAILASRDLDQRCLGRIPELRQRARCGGGRLDGGGVHGRRDAQPAGAESPGHVLLRGRGPGVVVLAVDDQHRDLIEPRELGRPVRRGEHVLGHQDQPVRVVAQHPLAQERDDVVGDSGRDGLRLQVGAPELGDSGRKDAWVRRALPIPGAEGGEHCAQLLRPRPGQCGRAGTHQRERHDLGAGPGLGEDGLAAGQPAVGVPDQVPRAGRAHDRGDVRSERRRGIAARIIGSRRLELAAHVDRDRVAAAVGQQVQDSEEVFLAAGVAGDEQGGFPLAYPGRRNRLQGRERAPGGVNRGSPDPVGQIEGGWCAHSGEPYLATLNKTSVSAPRKS